MFEDCKMLPENVVIKILGKLPITDLVKITKSQNIQIQKLVREALKGKNIRRERARQINKNVELYLKNKQSTVLNKYTLPELVNWTRYTNWMKGPDGFIYTKQGGKWASHGGPPLTINQIKFNIQNKNNLRNK